MFVHHVYFWLKNPESAQDLTALIDGLKVLATVPGLSHYHIGTPADTNRPVIDRSYAVSWLTIFPTAADEQVYQTHPVHLAFIEQCNHLWERVVVYDTEPVAYSDSLNG
jgi:Stress responsive A/B Barrel Domain